MKYIITCLFLVVLGACAPLVPATTPPQLDHTPGAFVVVTDKTFDAGIFQVDYPQTWRVVKTSIAEADAMQVVFVAPDTSDITLTHVDAQAESPNDNERYITLDTGVIVQVIIRLADEPDDNFLTHADQLIATIRTSVDD